MKSVLTHQGQYVVLNEFLIFVAKLFSTNIFVIIPLPSGPFPFDYIKISRINARWLCQLMRVCRFIHCFLLLSDKNTLESNWQKFIVANSELNMPMVSAAAVAPRKRNGKATLSGAIPFDENGDFDHWEQSLSRETKKSKLRSHTLVVYSPIEHRPFHCRLLGVLSLIFVSVASWVYQQF